ncbi:MAG: superoxide dismutase family protein [Pacificimonas sp.]
MLKTLLPALALGATLAACQSGGAANNDAPSAGIMPPADEVAYAQLAGADGTFHGRAVFTDDETGIDIDIALQNVPAGVHGVHVHETGSCVEPDFSSAGGHWNPTNVPHPEHKGDLGNVTVAADGTAALRTQVQGVSVADGDIPMLDLDGAALIVHSDADDMVSQPSGNAGSRIACAVIALG